MSAPSPAPRFQATPWPRVARLAAEAVLLAAVVLSPWLFACNEPRFELLLGAAAFLIVALWAVAATLTGRLGFRPDAVSLGFAALALVAACQLVPFPASALSVVAPARLAWQREFVPPGETAAWVPITVDPAATRLFLARALGLLLVYAAVRNWLATRDSLTRFAWAVVGNSTLLAFIALAQLFSGAGERALWLFPTGQGAIYGPFICRNHFPDYVNLGVGLAIGLLLHRPVSRLRPDGTPVDAPPALLSARVLGLGAALALMLVSVPFSMSRGGTVALAVGLAGAWLLNRARGPEAAAKPRGGPFRWAAGTTAVGVALLALWFGTGLVEQRLGTLTGPDAAQSRLPLWRDTARLVPELWATGCGAGAFVWASPTVRSDPAGNTVNQYAHNEYLEAAVEGGVVRLAATVALALGTLWAVGRGFLARRGRSVGPRLLGLFAGLLAAAVHAVGDFGLHMPAVAFATVAAAGFALAAATDPGFVPARMRYRKVTADDGEALRERDGLHTPAPDAPAAWATRGPAAALLGCALAGVALWCCLEQRRQARADDLRERAEAAFWVAGDPDRLDRRAALFAERAALVPGDPAMQYDAGQALIDAAVVQSWQYPGGLVGGAMAFARPPDALSPDAVRTHLAPALKFLESARALNPLHAKAHARLAVYGHYLPGGEPARVHFDRAKKLLPSDPDVWFAAGREAAGRGDLTQAVADWRHSVTVAPTHLPAILKAAGRSLPPGRIRDELLPADPATLLMAADLLYPDARRQAAGRRPLLEEVIALTAAPGTSPEALALRAGVFAELGRHDDAAAAWRAALDADPNRADTRDRYARWLGGEERYAEELEQLEWLRKHAPGSAALAERIDAAGHGKRLQDELARE